MGSAHARWKSNKLQIKEVEHPCTKLPKTWFATTPYSAFSKRMVTLSNRQEISTINRSWNFGVLANSIVVECQAVALGQFFG